MRVYSVRFLEERLKMSLILIIYVNTAAVKLEYRRYIMLMCLTVSD